MRQKKENTTSSTIAEGLRTEINFGRLKPCDKILEREIAEKFKVSHIPVREALKILEGEGFLMYEKFAGYRVREVTAEEMMELMSIMRFLTSQLLSRAIPRYTEITYYQLRSLTNEMTHSKNPEETISLVIQYAETVFFPAGMTYTYSLARQFLNRNIPVLQGLIKEVYQGKVAVDQFNGFIDLCQQGDSSKAIKFVLENYDRATKAFVAYISESRKKKKG